jgi:hypothetical protein
MGLLSIFGLGKSTTSSSAKVSFNLNVATPTTEVVIGSSADKSTGNSQLAVGVKTQDAAGKTLDLALNSLINTSKNGMSGQLDVAAKAQNGLNKAIDYSSSSLFNIDKNGATSQNVLNVATLNGEKISNSVFNGISAITKNGAAGQMDLGVKMQDGLNKALDFANSSQFNIDKNGAAGQTASGVATQDGTKVSYSEFDATGTATKDGAAGKMDLGVKMQDGLNKALDFANSSLFNIDKNGAAGQTTAGVATQDGTKVSNSVLDAIGTVTKDGAAGQMDLGVKMQDGLNKALDFANSSLFEATKDGAAGKTDLALAMKDGAKSTAALFDGLFSADHTSFTGKSGLDVKSQDAQNKFSLENLSLFTADKTGAAAQSDLGLLVQNSQKLATLTLSDLLQVGKEAIEFTGAHNLDVQKVTDAGTYLPVFNGGMDMQAMLPLQQETILA